MSTNNNIVELKYQELREIFREFEKLERENYTGNHINGYVVFTEDSFEKSYPLESRTYLISSDNKAFIPHMSGYSIYATSIDLTDKNVRLEQYMSDELGGKDGWRIEKCYCYQSELDKLNNLHNSYLTQKRLFVDMDGTLAVFNKVDTLETLYEEGYFRNLKPNMNVVNAVKEFIAQNPDVKVHILSAYLSDSKYALKEKNEWLDKYLPEIKQEDRIFPPCGKDKGDYIRGGYGENDYLLDDYTHNLTLWCPPGKGIKLLNGINHTKGTWKGKCVDYSANPHNIANSILNIMMKHQNRAKGNTVNFINTPAHKQDDYEL